MIQYVCLYIHLLRFVYITASLSPSLAHVSLPYLTDLFFSDSYHHLCHSDYQPLNFYFTSTALCACVCVSHPPAGPA